jgi:TolB-like protein
MTASRRASIAVIPFVDRDVVRGATSDALASDVITRLAKLRTLFVIARGMVFALHEKSLGAEEAGRTLNVDYIVSGSLQQDGSRLGVSVELTETRTARIVWAVVFNQTRDDTFAVLDEIGDWIVASMRASGSRSRSRRRHGGSRSRRPSVRDCDSC